MRYPYKGITVESDMREKLSRKEYAKMKWQRKRGGKKRNKWEKKTHSGRKKEEHLGDFVEFDELWDSEDYPKGD